jgi:hypothetical protein
MCLTPHVFARTYRIPLGLVHLLARGILGATCLGVLLPALTHHMDVPDVVEFQFAGVPIETTHVGVFVPTSIHTIGHCVHFGPRILDLELRLPLIAQRSQVRFIGLATTAFQTNARLSCTKAEPKRARVR